VATGRKGKIGSKEDYEYDFIGPIKPSHGGLVWAISFNAVFRTSNKALRIKKCLKNLLMPW
jgi:hypothetical protein